MPAFAGIFILAEATFGGRRRSLSENAAGRMEQA